MKKLFYFFTKNTSLPLYIVVLLLHIMRLIYLTYNVPIYEMNHPEILVNFLCVFLALNLVIFYKKTSQILLYSIFAVEIIGFALFEILTSHSTAGIEPYIFGILAGVYVLHHETNRSLKYDNMMNTAMTLALVFLIFYNNFMTPFDLIDSEQSRELIAKRISLNTILVIILFFYGCGITAAILRRSDQKVKKLQAKMDYTTKHDPLTGLMNRIRIHIVLKECTERKFNENIDFAVCILDIDDFKKINDTYGHDAGDFILKEYTQAIWNELKEPIRIGRWGGEEFLIIFPEITSDLIFKLDDLRMRIASKPFIYNGKKIPVSATYGISSSRTFLNSDEIITDADKNLLAGKNSGKNKLVVSEKF